MNKLYIVFIVILFIGCNDETKNKANGYFITPKIYEVIAYGTAPKNIKKEIQRRNMARESALLSAQLYIKNKFNEANLKYKSGIIVKVEYNNNNFCKLIYRVEINTNNSH